MNNRGVIRLVGVALLASAVSAGCDRGGGREAAGPTAESPPPATPSAADLPLDSPAASPLLAALRAGKPVPEAAAPAPPKGGEPVGLLVLNDAGRIHSWHGSLPAAWRANTVGGAQAVVVVEPVALQRDGSLLPGQPVPAGKRRYTARVTLREARTGNKLAAKTLYGRAPWEERPFGPASPYLVRHDGEPPTGEHLVTWLREYYGKPAEPPAAQPGD